jgi:cold shock protein
MSEKNEATFEEGKEYFGKVCWFSSRKGYGYLTRDDSGTDVFVHFSNLKMEGYKTLKPNQKVSFKFGYNANGPQAIEVVVTEDAPEKEEEFVGSKEDQTF